MAGSVVIMGNMVYKAYVTSEVVNGLVVLFTNTNVNIGGFSFNKNTRIFTVYEEKHVF